MIDSKLTEEKKSNVKKKENIQKNKCYKFIDGGKGRVEKKCNIFLIFWECLCLRKRGKQDKIREDKRREEKECNQTEKRARRRKEKENKIK